jgi:hypothetical protein
LSVVKSGLAVISFKLTTQTHSYGSKLRKKGVFGHE